MDFSCNPTNSGMAGYVLCQITSDGICTDTYQLQVLLDTVEVVISLSDKQISGLTRKQGSLNICLAFQPDSISSIYQLTATYCRRQYCYCIWRLDGLLYIFIHASPLQCGCHCHQCCCEIHSTQHSHHHDMQSNQMLHCHRRVEGWS